MTETFKIPVSIETSTLDSLGTHDKIRFVPDGMNLQDLVTSYSKSDVAGIFFCGAMTILMFFIFLLYVKNKEKIYIHYALFLFFMIIYGILYIETRSWFNDELFKIHFKARLVEPVTILSFSFYIFFAIELMEIKKKSKGLFRILYVWGYVAILYSLLYFLFFDYIKESRHEIFLVARTIIFPLSLYCLGWILIKFKSPIKNYFISGSVAYFIGAFVATLRTSFNNLPIPGFYEITEPIYFEGGIMVEVLCFALALGQRIYFLHQEKQEANYELIYQLSLNEQMTKSMNDQLEIEVQERTKEIYATQTKLQEQKQKRLNAEYEKELARSEMLARRLQINPHFIFNCLNAIKYLIQSKQNDKATLYLVIFSKFIRMVLDSSQKNVIPLTEELEIIENYLQLEKERFDNDFSYEINGGEIEYIHNLSIPPLILQPFVENAIWHGLLSSPKETKIVKINITTLKGTIMIAIEDNGIGRKQANELSIKKLYKSMGIYLTKERIKLYNHNYKNILNFDIIDKIDNNGISLGTRVEMTIQQNVIISPIAPTS